MFLAQHGEVPVVVEGAQNAIEKWTGQKGAERAIGVELPARDTATSRPELSVADAAEPHVRVFVEEPNNLFRNQDAQYIVWRTRRRFMPKYLLQVSYTADGARGLLKDGGSKRRDAARALCESVGGKIEAMYFAFGGTDVYVIADMPDAVSAAAASIIVGASGGATVKTAVLLSPEELDKAAAMSPKYTPPGR
jgi:uncharacterized protein with GYD domain